MILFEFSALEAEIILSFGHSWPFFFLLMRLYTITIKAGVHDVLLIKERPTITFGVTADSAVTPTVQWRSQSKYVGRALHDEEETMAREARRFFFFFF